MALPGEPTDSISHRVGISQGREYQRAFFGEIQPSDCVTTEKIRQAHQRICDAWNRLSQNHLRRMVDESMPEAARLRSSAQYAKQRLDYAQETYRNALEAGVQHHGAVQKELAEMLTPPGSPGRAAIAQEVRATLRNADESTKAEILQSDDAAVLHAIVSAPAGLSGITPELHRQLRDKFWEKTAPGLVAKANQLEDAIANLDIAKRKLQDHAESLVDFQSAAALEELAKELD